MKIVFMYWLRGGILTEPWISFRPKGKKGLNKVVTYFLLLVLCCPRNVSRDWTMEILVPLIDFSSSKTSSSTDQSIIRKISWLGTVNKNTAMYLWASVNQPQKVGLWRWPHLHATACTPHSRCRCSYKSGLSTALSSANLKFRCGFPGWHFFQSIEFTM